MRVGELLESDVHRWDAFVRACPEGTFFHLSGWKFVIEQTFGHRAHYLYAERDGAIRGVLPLVHIRSRLFHDALISNAFCVYGGPVAVDDTARGALDRLAAQLADRLGVDYLEYRCRAPTHPDWACNAELYATFRKRLDPDPERNFLAVPRKQRAMIRKGIKEGLVSEIDMDPARMYRLYTASLRNLGTPAPPKSYFFNLMQRFRDSCEVLTVCRNGQPLSAVMTFFFRDEVLPYYGGGTAEARTVAANDFMYWEVMCRACERGSRTFDFGRSKRGTGSFDFKRHWGFAPQPLYYEYRLRPGDTMPEMTPLNPKYRLYIEMWKRLPLPVANFLGPFVARDLG